MRLDLKGKQLLKSNEDYLSKHKILEMKQLIAERKQLKQQKMLLLWIEAYVTNQG